MTFYISLIKAKTGIVKEEMLDGLTKWPEVGWMTDALKVIRYKNVWTVMIAYTKG